MDPPPTEIYTLSLHDALPICAGGRHAACAAARAGVGRRTSRRCARRCDAAAARAARIALHLRSEEHTSELQSRQYLVCRLLLEKKKKTEKTMTEQVPVR